MIVFFVAMWNLIIYVAIGGEGDSDFSDGGAAPAQQQQEKQKVVKLMQRQQKPAHAQQTFRTTAISDITLPDFNELDAKDLSPVVNAAAPSTGNANEQRRHEERAQRHWLVASQDHAAALRPQEKTRPLRREEGRK